VVAGGVRSGIRARAARAWTWPCSGACPSAAAAAARSAAAKLTSRTLQSGSTSKDGRTGKGNPCLRAALGRAAMTAAKTDIYLGERYRRIARRRGKKKAIVAVSRTICEIAWMIITGPSARVSELGPDYYARLDAGRQTRNKIRELERLNPGMKVTVTPAATAA